MLFLIVFAKFRPNRFSFLGAIGPIRTTLWKVITLSSSSSPSSYSLIGLQQTIKLQLRFLEVRLVDCCAVLMFFSAPGIEMSSAIIIAVLILCVTAIIIVLIILIYRCSCRPNNRFVILYDKLTSTTESQLVKLTLTTTLLFFAVNVLICYRNGCEK